MYIIIIIVICVKYTQNNNVATYLSDIEYFRVYNHNRNIMQYIIV